MPLTFSLTNEQKVAGITSNPKTGGGAPSTVENLAVSIIDGNPNATGMIEADGSISLVSGNGADGLGPTVFKVTGDKIIGEGTEEISDTITINVQSPNAADLGLGGGTVVNK